MDRYAGFDLVLIAASQGGLRVCRGIVAELPPDFPAALVYAQHRSPGASTAAADLLRRSTDLQVRAGIDGMELTPGTITVPPADVHVRVTAGAPAGAEPRAASEPSSRTSSSPPRRGRTGRARSPSC